MEDSPPPQYIPPPKYNRRTELEDIAYGLLNRGLGLDLDLKEPDSDLDLDELD